MATTQFILARSLTVPTASGTKYMGFGGSLFANGGSTAAGGITPWSIAGTFKRLKLSVDTALGIGNSVQFTVYKNGVATAMTVTIGGAATSAQDTTHTFSVSPGDYLAIELLFTGSVSFGSAQALTYSVEFDPTTDGESCYALQVANVNDSSIRWQGVFCGVSATAGNWAGTSNVGTVCPIAGTITAAYLRTSGASPGVGKRYDLYIYKNGVKQDGTGGTVNTLMQITDGNTTGTASFSLPVVPGDVLYVEATGVGSPSIIGLGIAFAFQATTAGEFAIVGFGTGGGFNTSLLSSNYNKPAGQGAWTGSEAIVTQPGLISALNIAKLWLATDVAPGGSAVHNAWLRANGVDTALTATITGANKTGSGTATVLLSPSDSLVMRNIATGATPATGAWGSWGLAAMLPGNTPPVVDAGPDVTAPFTGSGTLAGSVSDDGFPNPPAALTIAWSVLFQTGTIMITDPTDPTSGYTVDIPGTYILVLTADDGDLSSSDTVTLTFNDPPNPDASCPAASAGPAICGAENVLTWIEQTQRKTDATTETRVTSDAALNDEPAYYSGRKEPVITQLPEITRQLSSVFGQWQASTIRWREAESDRAVRKRFASTLRYPVTNTIDVCRMIRESDYAARNDARLMFIGHRLRSTPLEDMTVEHESGDQLARDLEVAGEEVRCPRRRFSPAFTPGIPTGLVDVPEPIVYGKHSDELSSATPPDMIADPTWGGFMDGGIFPNHGWAPMPGPTPPTGVALSLLAGGAIDAGDFPGDDAYVVIVGIDANGDWGDPTTFAYLDPSQVDTITITGSGNKIRVQWTNPPGNTAVTWRVGLGLFFSPVVRYLQFIDVAGSATEAIFDNAPDFTEFTLNDYSQIATGAAVNGYSVFGYYHAAALMPDGTWTALAPVAGIAPATLYPRWSRIEATNIPAGATAIGFWQFAPGLSAFDPNAVADFAWSVPVSHTLPSGHVYLDIERTTADPFGTDMITLALPRELGRLDLEPYYGGLELVPSDGGYRPRYFVASHACPRVRLIVDGTVQTTPGSWIWPGTPEYTARFGNAFYRDFAGRRYSVLYGPVVPAGGTPTPPTTIRANVWGVESSGDGTGVLYTDGHDQFLHWFVNFGPLGNYQSGAWLTAPTWAPIASHCKIDAESFRTLRDAAALLLPGGIVCAGVIKDLDSLRNWIAKWVLCLDARIGPNAAGQWKLVRHDPTAVPSATYTETLHFLQGAVTFEPLHDEHWTSIPYRFGYDPVTDVWQEGTATAAQQETDYGEPRPGPEFELFFVQAPSIAQWIMNRVKDRHKILPWRVAVDLINLCGTNSDFGDVIGITGTWGLGMAGWDAYPVFLEWHTVKTPVQRVRLTGRTNKAPNEVLAE